MWNEMLVMLLRCDGFGFGPGGLEVVVVRVATLTAFSIKVTPDIMLCSQHQHASPSYLLRTTNKGSSSISFGSLHNILKAQN